MEENFKQSETYTSIDEENIPLDSEIVEDTDVVLNDFPMSVVKTDSDVSINVEKVGEKENIFRGIRDKLGIDGLEGRRLRHLACIASVTTMMFAASCTKVGAGLIDPFVDNTPKVELVSNIEGKEMVTREKDQTSLENIWEKAKSFWPNTRLEDGKEYLFEQAEKYSQMYPQYSKELLLSVFTSIAMTESNGGIHMEPNYVGARGWFQVIPLWHLNEYNLQHGTNYSEDDLSYDDQASIEVGTWSLMRYADRHNLADCMKIFKSGTNIASFGQWGDDGIWWNRVSYSMRNLLGEDVLNMGQINYIINYQEYPAEKFLESPEDIGNVFIQNANRD